MEAERVRTNLERVREAIGPDVEVLAAVKYLEVDDLPALAEGGVTLVGENRAQQLAGEESKAGIAPAELPRYIERSPVPVTGLATMPPEVERAEDNRRHFARLAELAAEHGLSRLSMGTSQDYEVAVQEGATIVRLGSVLYA